MIRASTADLPLHHGRVPRWLAERMSRLGGAIIESVILEYGRGEVLRRLSDPMWFQALGCVLGMDWHSSGITTSVMGALKASVNMRAGELGLYICGGRGKHSRQTPAELLRIAAQTGLDGDALVRASKLTAKVDNTAVQDGFQLYLHSFVLTNEGEWAVIQQGLNDATGMARRYHWHSAQLRAYLEEPHAAVCGIDQGLILNLTAQPAAATKAAILGIAQENPDKMLSEIKHITMPRHHDVRGADVDLKRLGAVLLLAHDQGVDNFENLLLLEGLGPRTLQSLTLVSEVIHGTSSRFRDPARFSFAHGGKDGHPFPVPLTVYDETIAVLRSAVAKAKLGYTERNEALKQLSVMAQRLENNFEPKPFLAEIIEKERRESYHYGGMTVKGPAKPPKNHDKTQLSLF